MIMRYRMNRWWSGVLQRGTCVLGGMAVAVATCFFADASAASSYVNVEAVNDYSQCNGPSLTNSIADGQGFWNSMLAKPPSLGSPLFTAGTWWTDNFVWASDFYDKERTGLSTDSDHLYFDKPD